jgi:hemolysin III
VNVPLWGIADPVAAATHLFGLVGSGACAVSLWRRSEGIPSARITTSIYAGSSALLFLASTAYHTWSGGDREPLRRLDHAMIYVFIAGTFTPIVGHLARDPLRKIVLATVWMLALLGVVLKLFFFGATPEWVDVALYCGMGWFGIVPFPQIVRARSFLTALWLPLGGTLYSLGALSELHGWPIFAKGYFGFHEVFHILVLLASWFFYLFVWRHVLVKPATVKVEQTAVAALPHP